MCIERLLPENYHKCGDIWDMSANEAITRNRYDEIVSGNRITFVYLSGDKYIGELSLVIRNEDPDYTIDGKRIYLSRMIVKAENRNCGIGTKLLHHAVLQARSKGYAEMSVGVDIANFGARWLYEKNGFTNIIKLDEDSAGKYVKLMKTL